MRDEPSLLGPVPFTQLSPGRLRREEQQLYPVIRATPAGPCPCACTRVQLPAPGDRQRDLCPGVLTQPPATTCQATWAAGPNHALAPERPWEGCPALGSRTEPLALPTARTPASPPAQVGTLSLKGRAPRVPGHQPSAGFPPTARWSVFPLGSLSCPSVGVLRGHQNPRPRAQPCAPPGSAGWLRLFLQGRGRTSRSKEPPLRPRDPGGPCTRQACRVGLQSHSWGWGLGDILPGSKDAISFH